MGRLKKAILALLGEDEPRVQTMPAPQNQTVEQAPGTLVTLESQNVSLDVVGDNDRVKIRQAPVQMGGEEIKPGTLHCK